MDDFSRRMFNYSFDKLENKRLDYMENTVHRIIQEVTNIAEDFEIELSHDELQDLCYKIYSQNLTIPLDNKILEICKQELSLGD